MSPAQCSSIQVRASIAAPAAPLPYAMPATCYDGEGRDDAVVGAVNQLPNVVAGDLKGAPRLDVTGLTGLTGHLTRYCSGAPRPFQGRDLAREELLWSART